MQCTDCANFVDIKRIGDDSTLRCRDGMGGVCEQDAASALLCIRFEERWSAQKGLFE